MKALLCVEHGPPEALELKSLDTPTPGRGEILVRVHAAGVNFPDTLIIRNLYQFKPALPFAPGGEAAGVVEAVGEGVTRWSLGDRVVAMTGHGAFATHLVAQDAQLIAMPDGMDFATAAGFTMTYGTSHHALKQRARLAEGETLLVLGAAGGVGLAAVELGRLMGAEVIAAASSPEKLALARDYGAAHAIDYSSEDLRERLKAITGGRGPDVIYDPVGDRYSEPAFRSIAWGGRHLVVGFAAGEIPKVALNLPLIKGASLVGVFWGAFTMHEPELHRANMEELVRWQAEGRLRPHVSQKLPLERGGEAIRLLMDRKAMGKVIVTMDHDS